VRDDLKGMAMTDPKEAITHETPAEGELPVEELDAVTGGVVNEGFGGLAVLESERQNAWGT
jgi:hypothetical protein